MGTASTDIHTHLIEKARKNDRSAQFELYRLYSKAMLNVSFRIVSDRDEAEDVLQESFVSAFRNLGKYRGDASFGSWLKRIVVNNSINAVKKRKLDFVDVDDLKEGVEPEEEVIGDVDLDVGKVKEAVDLLPKGFKMVLSLYLLEGYDHKEIGQIMGISESTSKSQFNRAKKKLKTILKDIYSYER